jgi:hypothetical protein
MPPELLQQGCEDEAEIFKNPRPFAKVSISTDHTRSLSIIVALTATLASRNASTAAFVSEHLAQQKCPTTVVKTAGKSWLSSEPPSQQDN